MSHHVERGGQNSAGQAGEGERLAPNLAWAGQGGEEESFSPEKRILDAADKLNVIVDRSRQGDKATCVELEHLAHVQLPAHQRAAGMDQGDPIAGQPLHDKAFAAKKAHAEPFLEGDANSERPWPHKETSLSGRSVLRRTGRDGMHDFAGIGRGEGHLFPA